MAPNIGGFDRVFRLLLASALFYLGLFRFTDSPVGIGMDVAGGVFLVTAAIGFCGLYQLLGIRTSQPDDSL